MMARRLPVAWEAALRVLIVFSWLAKSPCEKLSRATSMPARIISSMISLDPEAGPIVQTILVLWFGKAIFIPPVFVIVTKGTHQTLNHKH